MLQTISIVVVTLRQPRAVQTSPTFEGSLPLLAVSNEPSPRGWAQNWAHEFLGAANCSSNSTSRGRSSLPWAQGVAGSNPVAPIESIGATLSWSKGRPRPQVLVAGCHLRFPEEIVWHVFSKPPRDSNGATPLMRYVVGGTETRVCGCPLTLVLSVADKQEHIRALLTVP